MVVITSVIDSGENVAHVRKWLARHNPEWCDFRIEAVGKYLGFMVGPKANSRQWVSPLKKFVDRATDIGTARAPLSASMYMYNVQATTVLQYVAQLCNIPDELPNLEWNSLHKILHFATNALTIRGFLHLHEYGGPHVRSAQCGMRAAMLRTAIRFKHIWQSWLNQIETVAATLPNPRRSWSSSAVSVILGLSAYCQAS